MGPSPQFPVFPLMDALQELASTLAKNPAQPLSQFAENMVLLWLRVTEAKDFVPPRLQADGCAPRCFPHGMEPRMAQRLDPVPPFSEPAGYLMERNSRLAQMAQEIGGYFDHAAYRSSSDSCDTMMVELERVSRFFSTCCFDTEALERPDFPPSPGGVGTAVGVQPETPAGALVNRVRRDLLIWEPLFNDCIVTWEQNSLTDFDRTLKVLAALAPLDDQQREPYRVPPGHPLRPARAPRQKVLVNEPVQRPLRTKSMFSVRHGQLMRRLEELGTLPPETIQALEDDVAHFRDMIDRNIFMLAGPPGFWGSHRAGMPLIRGRPGTHPLLLDPTDFFKKAVLFHNGTYTPAGGGIDWMYLQVRQLERYYKFQAPGGYLGLRQQIETCLRGWQENRKGVFTEGLLEVAESLRKQAPPRQP